MLKALLTSRSLLLTRGGWKMCGLMPRELLVAGFDRHGQLQMKNISLSQTGAATRPAFLGTTACCGFFSSGTRLRDASGTAWQVGNLVQSGTIGDLRFETALSAGSDLGVDDEQLRLLWDALCVDAAEVIQDTATVRFRSDLDGTGRRRLCGTLLVSRERLYLSANRRQMLDTANADRIIDTIATIFRDGKGHATFSRDAFAAAMALAAVSTRDGIPYELTYDTLQHTAQVSWQGCSAKETLARGRCAHFVGTAENEWTASWSEPLWHPVSNGFLLSGGK
jgi:hypothetical protein